MASYVRRTWESSWNYGAAFALGASVDPFEAIQDITLHYTTLPLLLRSRHAHLLKRLRALGRRFRIRFRRRSPCRRLRCCRRALQCRSLFRRRRRLGHRRCRASMWWPRARSPWTPSRVSTGVLERRRVICRILRSARGSVLAHAVFVLRGKAYVELWLALALWE